ncbi:MAG: penicillin-binding transpeptidase domain-containing protein [Flavobacteriales bacterium]
MSNKSFESRRIVLLVIMLSMGFIFAIRLLFIQVIDDKWNNESIKISETRKIIEPDRGIIFDRNGKVMAVNQTNFELRLTPNKVKDFDTAQLSELLNIPFDSIKPRINKLKRYWRSNQLFVKTVPKANLARLTSLMFKYKGFELREKSLRVYPANSAAHLLGYVREVDGDIIKKKPYYRGGDRIGISGLEKYYEDALRGSRGNDQFLRDAYGNLKQLTASDTAKSGNNLTTSIDLELQRYGEQLMQNKIGSLVAIDPSSGEILAVISSPTFDPNLLTGDTMSRSWRRLRNNDSLKPLFNRALKSRNSPGSIFKMIQGLTAWELGVIDQGTKIFCDKSIVGCHGHPPVSGLSDAIKYSCNPYFYETFKRITTSREGEDIFEKSRKGLNLWNDYVSSFGLGQDLQLDYPGYSTGNIPLPKVYDKIYNKRWSYRTCNSLAIGQGEMIITSYQMANLACVMANRGHYYFPHFIKEIENNTINPKYKQKQFTKISSEKFEPIVDAMQQVIEGEGGTASRARIEGIEICGKTGTVENSRGKDHSVFIAFAPKYNPKIAIAVYIENGGYGGTWAAPIASLMTEKYLTDSVSNTRKQQRILDANLIPKK